MAKNEPNRPDDVKTTPANESPAEKQTAPATTPPEIAGDNPAPELTAEEAATPAHEGEAALQEMGEAEIEPPTPLDIGGEHIPDPGDIVVPFDKINELVSEKQKASPEAGQTDSEKKSTRRGRSPKTDKSTEEPSPEKTVPQEAQEAVTEDTRQEWEKPLSEIEAKKERKPRAEKQKFLTSWWERVLPRCRTVNLFQMQRKRPRLKRKPPPRSRRNRRNRRKRRARVDRNRLYILTCPSYTPSKITRSQSGTMKKCGLWWKSSRTRALHSLQLSAISLTRKPSRRWWRTTPTSVKISCRVNGPKP